MRDFYNHQEMIYDLEKQREGEHAEKLERNKRKVFGFWSSSFLMFFSERFNCIISWFFNFL